MRASDPVRQIIVDFGFFFLFACFFVYQQGFQIVFESGGGG